MPAPISAHRGTARLAVPDATAGELVYPLELKSANITLDEAWSPYCQGTVVVTIPAPAIAALLDPRKKIRLQLDLSQTFGDSDTLAAISAQFAGGTLAAISAAYPGTLAAITTARYRPFNTGPFLNVSARSFNLSIRSVEIDRTAAEATLTVASDEALLQDFRLAEPVFYQPGGTAVRTLAVLALARIGATLTAGPRDGIVAAAATAWLPGVSAAEWLAPMIQSVGLRLWCDELRRWQLTVSQPYLGLPAVAPQVSPKAGSTEKLTRADEWCDAAIVVYSWTDAGNIPRRQVDTHTTPGWSKAVVQELDSVYPGPGAAARIVGFAMSRGRSIEYSSVSDYNVNPGMVIDMLIPGIEQYATIGAVAWNLPADEMRLTLRDLSNSVLLPNT